MTTVMSMSDYEIESESSDSGYGEEIMYTGWNPEIDSVHEQLQIVPTGDHSAIPDDLATTSAALFLRKMYSYQR